MAIQVNEVQKALGGVDYPADREQLVSHAESNGADDDVVEALRAMDRESFDGPNAVMEELGDQDALGGPADE